MCGSRWKQLTKGCQVGLTEDTDHKCTGGSSFASKLATMDLFWKTVRVVLHLRTAWLKNMIRVTNNTGVPLEGRNVGSGC